MKPALKSADMSTSSSSGSFITPSAIGSGSSSEGQVPGLLGSSLKELKTPSEAWAELSDAEGEEVDGEVRAGVGGFGHFYKGHLLFLFC